MKRVLVLSMALGLTVFGFADPPEHVHIFLFKPNMPDSASNPLKLKAVDRQISGESDPKPQTMNALLAGPMRTEIRQGFGSLDTDGVTYWKITKSGNNYGVFFKATSHHHWSGDLSAGRFKQAVDKTMHQFPNVSRVTVFVNGHSDFDHG